MVKKHHNHGVKWTSPEVRTLVKKVKKAKNREAVWKTITQEFNAELPWSERSEKSLNSLFARTLEAAKYKYTPGCGDTAPIRCRKIDCGLLKLGHVCLNEDGDDLSDRAAKRLNAEADAFLNHVAHAMGKESFTYAEANDFLAARRELEGHEFFLDKLDHGIDPDQCAECVIPLQFFPPAPGDDQMIDSWCDWSSELVEQ